MRTFPKILALALAALLVAPSFSQAATPTPLPTPGSIGPSCTIDTVAGNGTAASGADGIAASSSSMNNTRGVAADSLGGFYFSDSNSNRVRYVDPSGIVHHFAGSVSGSAGYAGDAGQAAQAYLSNPGPLILASDGSLFICDTGNNVVRRVNPSGVISTFAGNGATAYSSAEEGAPAINAHLNSVAGLALDGAGSLFVSDTNNHRVRKVDGSGNITTYAGNGTGAYAGDNGPATAASLFNPNGLFIDAGGNLYIADVNNQRVREVFASNGSITTVAGTGTAGFSGDGGPPLLAQLNNPKAVAVDASGHLVIADAVNNRLRALDSFGNISTVAGEGSSLGDGGPAISAQFNEIREMNRDPFGNLYLCDRYQNRIRKITACNPAPTATPTFTFTRTKTASPTPTRSPTATRTPSSTATRTATLTRTYTFSPTLSPTPCSSKSTKPFFLRICISRISPTSCPAGLFTGSSPMACTP